MATLVNHYFCSIKELSEALGVPGKNIERYAKALKGKGISHFFNRKKTRGQCHKFTTEKMQDDQELLDKDFDSSILTLAFIYLCRIKSVEQLKHHSPGEIGKYWY
jgi:hypothetical protein